MSAATNDLIGANPNLGPLQDNSGPTVTHELVPGSPAIERGNPAAPGSSGNACAATDQRSIACPMDGDANGVSRCDIGAYELVGPKGADLGVTLAAGATPADLGGQVIFTAAVSNGGPAGSTASTLTLTLPSGLTSVSASASQGSCQGTGPITRQLGSLTAGSTATVTMAPTVTAGGSQTVSAQVADAVTDPVPGNNQTSASTTAPTACAPRPSVGLQTVRLGPGQIQGTLTAGRPGYQPDNALTQIQITRLDNATITVNGEPASAGETVTLPAGATQAQVVVTRAAGGAFVARLSVTDACGAWPTLVGGGTGF